MSDETVACVDANLTADRTLDILIATQHVPVCLDYQANSSVTHHMRDVIAAWIKELCERNRSHHAVATVSIILFDKYLHIREVPKKNLQLVACACLFIAAKLHESYQYFSAGELAYLTERTYTTQEVLECELDVLDALEWRVSLVTAHDFVFPVVERLRLGCVRDRVCKDAHVLISEWISCSQKYRSNRHTAIAAACICQAVQDCVTSPVDTTDLASRIDNILRISVGRE